MQQWNNFTQTQLKPMLQPAVTVTMPDYNSFFISRIDLTQKCTIGHMHRGVPLYTVNHTRYYSVCISHAQQCWHLCWTELFTITLCLLLHIILIKAMISNVRNRNRNTATLTSLNDVIKHTFRCLSRIIWTISSSSRRSYACNETTGKIKHKLCHLYQSDFRSST